MSYKEFVLLYTTLILGLACSNIFYGLGEIIHGWRRIKISWYCFLPCATLLLTVIDFWFHAFMFPYDTTNGHIILFLIYLFPPIILFFNTLIIFPEQGSGCVDYNAFFQQALRNNVLTYGLMLLATLAQFYLTQFMFSTFYIPILVYLAVYLMVYLTNSAELYQITALAALLLNVARWTFEWMMRS